MIHALVATDPERAILPWYRKVRFLHGKVQLGFLPGVNIIFGPNASGKSTIIQTLAKTLCVFQGGVSTLTEQAIRGYRGNHLLGTAMGTMLDGVLPDHDGRGVIQHIAHPVQGYLTGGGPGRKPVLQLGVHEIAVYGRRVCTRRLGRVHEHAILRPEVVPKPDVSFASKKFLNDVWKADARRVVEILEGTGQGTIPTVLLDEPDRSLSIPYAANLWDNIASNADHTKTQVMAATHSPFAMDLPGVHYIETEPGYLEACRETYRRFGERYALAL